MRYLQSKEKKEKSGKLDNVEMKHLLSQCTLSHLAMIIVDDIIMVAKMMVM